MKPSAPQVPLSVWKELYTSTARFQAARPWELLDDLDVIGIRRGTSGQTGYGIVMGSGGTLFGYCLYRGGSSLGASSRPGKTVEAVEAENARLRKVIADLTIDNAIWKEASRGYF